MLIIILQPDVCKTIGKNNIELDNAREFSSQTSVDYYYLSVEIKVEHLVAICSQGE